jgi:hypothetical protein
MLLRKNSCKLRKEERRQLGKKEREKMLENCGSGKDKKIQEYTLGKKMKS